MIEICENASDIEKDIYLELQTNNGNWKYKFARDILEHFDLHCKNGIAELGGDEFSHRSLNPQTGHIVICSNVPALVCDFCFQTKEKLGLTMLQCCGACRSSFYCSNSCQKKHWKQIDKSQCRKKGEFKAGDVARIGERCGSLDIHDEVTIVSPVDGERGVDEQERFLVVSFDDDAESVVPTKVLRNMRPIM